MNRREALDIVARRVIADATDGIKWEDYPDIGEHDWDRVTERVVDLAPDPGGERFEKAYALLSSLANSNYEDVELPDPEETPPVPTHYPIEIAKDHDDGE